MIIGFTVGVWDLLHMGHLNFLRECKKQCDTLIVGVLMDDVMERHKRAPIIPIMERLALVNALECVDRTTVMFTYDPVPYLIRFQPDKYFHGDDIDYLLGEEYVKRMGGEIVYIPYYKKQSTTDIIKKIMTDYSTPPDVSI